MSAPKSEWFAEEVQPHEPALRGYLRSLFPSLVDIDDLVQEAYVKLLRAKDAGKISYAKAFLFSSARNAAFDLFRRRKIVSIVGVADLNELSVLDDRPGAPAALIKQEELKLLAEAVGILPERCRQVMTLRLLYGLSYKEIAANLGLSVHTVKAQLAKGMRRCADYFSERGLVTSQVPVDEPPS